MHYNQAWVIAVGPSPKEQQCNCCGSESTTLQLQTNLRSACYFFIPNCIHACLDLLYYSCSTGSTSISAAFANSGFRNQEYNFLPIFRASLETRVHHLIMCAKRASLYLPSVLNTNLFLVAKTGTCKRSLSAF